VTTTAYRTQTEFTATAGQTTFSVPSYTVGFIDVYRNGLLLGSPDFTATNGTTVVLTNAASAGDFVETVSFYVSSVLNALPNTGGTLSGGLIVNGNLTTSGNTVLGDASTDTLNVGNGGLVKDASGNVGIGTASPDAKLEVTIGDNGGINIEQSGLSQTGYLTFRDSDGGLDGRVSYDHSNNAMRFTTATTERMRLDSSGNLLVGGTTSPSGSGNIFVATTAFIGTTNADPTFNRVTGMQVRSDGAIYTRSSASWDMGRSTTSGAHMTFYTDNGSARVQAGSISSNGSTTTYGTGSDYRMKQNIQTMQDALGKLFQLKPVTYEWKPEFAGTNVAGQGFIAHELQAVVPECVTGEKDAVDADGNPIHQGIDTSFLVATLVSAIQEQQAIITQLQADVAALKGNS
jgi:hypothetical protein